MGIIWDKYRSGINLGGWISQCRYEKAHIDSFIQKEDIDRIASWGLDHIRLPFDYPVLEDDDKSFVYKEEGFAMIDKVLGWCKEAGLNLVLDMHKAPGYAFGNKAEDNTLFNDEQTQRRFIALWEEMAKRYINEGDDVIFELMNEITDPHGDTWNKIARRAIEAIFAIDPKRYILLGGPYYNAVNGLETLEIWDNERVLYNFHFYEPFLFTHQRASWTHLKDTGIHQPYPGKIEGVDVLQKLYREQNEQGRSVDADVVFNYAFLEEKLGPAIAFIEKHGKELYCGEYGAIDKADLESRTNYLKDTNALFEKYRMGRACWTYKRMDFPSIDEHGEAISAAYVQAMRVKCKC